MYCASSGTPLVVPTVLSAFTLSAAAAQASNEPGDLLKINEAERVRLSVIIRQQLMIDISNEPTRSAPVVAMVTV